MQILEPKPIRKSEDWAQLKGFAAVGLIQTHADILNVRASVNCRECLGFGHARTCCPLKKKFDDRRLSDYIRSVIGQHRKLMAAIKPSEIKSYTEWPFIKHVNDWVKATKTKLGDKYKAYADQEQLLNEFVAANKDLVCKACSGFGHTTDDY